MSNTQQQLQEFTSIGFQIEGTKDGSPTLRLPQQGESMHHSGGAAAETNYIYGTVLQSAHHILRDSCKTCVVGLGLGYIEMSWAASLVRNGLAPSSELSFHSFEIVPGLIENFCRWVESKESHSVYDLIFSKLAPDVSLFEVKAVLQKALKNGSTLNGDFADLNQHRQRYNIICYDAFSKKTSEELWQVEFLENFFRKYAATDCVVTTYACIGAFRKALQDQAFAFFKRPSFNGKRDSSLATKGKLSLENFPISQISSCNR